MEESDKFENVRDMRMRLHKWRACTVSQWGPTKSLISGTRSMNAPHLRTSYRGLSGLSLLSVVSIARSHRNVTHLSKLMPFYFVHNLIVLCLHLLRIAESDDDFVPLLLVWCCES